MGDTETPRYCHYDPNVLSCVFDQVKRQLGKSNAEILSPMIPTPCSGFQARAFASAESEAVKNFDTGAVTNYDPTTFCGGETA